MGRVEYSIKAEYIHPDFEPDWYSFWRTGILQVQIKANGKPGGRHLRPLERHAAVTDGPQNLRVSRCGQDLLCSPAAASPSPLASILELIAEGSRASGPKI